MAVATLAAATVVAVTTLTAHSEQREQPATAAAPVADVDWDRPIAGGVVTEPSSAERVGELPFAPVVPSFDVPVTVAMVTDAATTDRGHRAFGLMYRFPVGDTYPADGRVVVLESLSQVGADQLKMVAEHNAAIAGDHFRYLLIDGHVPAVLVQDRGIGRVHLVVNGIAIDVTGPAAAPDAVLDLATRLVRDAGASPG